MGRAGVGHFLERLPDGKQKPSLQIFMCIDKPEAIILMYIGCVETEKWLNISGTLSHYLDLMHVLGKSQS